MDAHPHKDTPTCLVVEDQLEILGTMTRALTRSGWVVLGAGSAAEARAHLAGQLQLAVIDLGLPDCPGDEFAHELRIHHPEVPILIVSGGAESELQDIAMRLGKAEVLSKPFSMRTLTDLAAQHRLHRAEGGA